ncbi:MAG: hypothetical protein RJB66_533 [Pseudomonadota bacterium]|jgi:hypothetical protein
MNFSLVFAVVVGLTSFANARTFYKTQWAQSFSYSNAIAETAVQKSLELTGTATYSDDFVFCQITLDEKRIPCQMFTDRPGITAFFKTSEYITLLKNHSKKLDPSGRRTLEIVIAHLENDAAEKKENDRESYEGILIKILFSKYSDRITQFHDPASDFESVHRRSSATLVRSY